MIASKKISLIAAVLVVAALTFIAFMFINPPESVNTLGTVTYGEGHSVNFASSDYFSGNLSGEYKQILLDNENVSITAGGTYVLSGTLSGGSVTVDIPDDTVVNLILNEVHITAENGPAIIIEDAKKAVISIVSGTVSTLTDAAAYESNDYDACIYSKADLVIGGGGNLTVNALYEDGIKTNDSLKIMEGTITITSVDEAISANDYIVMKNGSLTISSGGDGMKCENTDDNTLGFIALDGGSIDVTTEADGIWAGSDIYVNDTASTITAADDAVHTEATLHLNGGTINIPSCYEGLEGAYIEINDGNYNIKASDDAFNATGKNSSGSMPFPMGGRNNTDRDISSNAYMIINGGTIYAESGGDGLDSNSAAIINGGYIEVYGPENSGNSTLDFDGGFIINGGTVLAAGSSGMAESPTTQSAQNTIIVTLSKTYDAGTSFSLTDENEKVIVSGASSKRFDWLCISSKDITTDSAYTVKVGENQEATVTVSSVITSVRNSSAENGGFGRPMGGNMGGFGGRQHEDRQPPSQGGFPEGEIPPEMPEQSGENTPPEPPNFDGENADARPAFGGGRRRGRGGMPGGGMTPPEGFGNENGTPPTPPEGFGNENGTPPAPPDSGSEQMPENNANRPAQTDIGSNSAADKNFRQGRFSPDNTGNPTDNTQREMPGTRELNTNQDNSNRNTYFYLIFSLVLIIAAIIFAVFYKRKRY